VFGRNGALGMLRRMANSEPTLQDKIGQMVLAGFRGLDLSDADPIIQDLRTRNLGAAILFDQEMADKNLPSRNIQSPAQVKALVAALHQAATTPLLVSIDQEGGRVNRLKADYGFPETLSHEELGGRNDLAFTFRHAELIAKTLADLGINLNLAPVVDLDANPDNPIIKGKKRSFHSDPEIVAMHALEYTRAHLKHGVLTCPKHFPGHGSAMGDTHLGLVNVTKTWNERELIPFKRMIESGLTEIIMTAHVFNASLDPDRPATLSKRVLQGILRDQLGYRGLIVSDDMEMRAITSQYGLENAIQFGIEAGLDMLCFGNNMSYDLNIGEKVIGIIERLVQTGMIAEARIDESYRRILALKQRLP
jgi:beta-N-acetylhexosaminidase